MRVEINPTIIRLELDLWRILKPFLSLGLLLVSIGGGERVVRESILKHT